MKSKIIGCHFFKQILHNQQVDFDDKHIYMKIEDNGAGFNINELKHREGLTNMQHRAEEMNATLKIESVIGQGTVVAMELQINS